MITRQQLYNEYIEFISEYSSIPAFAEARGLDLDEAELLIKLSESCFMLNR